MKQAFNSFLIYSGRVGCDCQRLCQRDQVELPAFGHHSQALQEAALPGTAQGRPHRRGGRQLGVQGNSLQNTTVKNMTHFLCGLIHHFYTL